MVNATNSMVPFSEDCGDDSIPMVRWNPFPDHTKEIQQFVNQSYSNTNVYISTGLLLEPVVLPGFMVLREFCISWRVSGKDNSSQVSACGMESRAFSAPDAYSFNESVKCSFQWDLIFSPAMHNAPFFSTTGLTPLVVGP